MAYKWQVLGHQKQKEFLTKAIDSGRLAHAYVFSGPDGVGKRSLARNLAQILLCEQSSSCGECVQCKSFNTSHPDYLEVTHNETLKVEDIRQLLYQLSLKPYQGKYKIAVVDRAEDMTTETANALLKSMEEPKSHTIIILVTSNPYRLIPTILSRAQKMSFGLVSESDYGSLLPADLSAEQKQIIETFAFGRPGTALSIARDNEVLEKLTEVKSQYERFASGDLAEKLKVAAELAEAESLDIKDALLFWLASLERDLVRDNSTATAKKISAVSRALKLFEANVNLKLLLTEMVLD